MRLPTSRRAKPEAPVLRPIREDRGLLGELASHSSGREVRVVNVDVVIARILTDSLDQRGVGFDATGEPNGRYVEVDYDSASYT